MLTSLLVQNISAMGGFNTLRNVTGDITIDGTDIDALELTLPASIIDRTPSLPQQATDTWRKFTFTCSPGYRALKHVNMVLRSQYNLSWPPVLFLHTICFILRPKALEEVGGSITINNNDELATLDAFAPSLLEVLATC